MSKVIRDGSKPQRACLTKAPVTQFQLTVTKYFSGKARNLDILLRNLLIFNMSFNFLKYCVDQTKQFARKLTTLKHELDA